MVRLNNNKLLISGFTINKSVVVENKDRSYCNRQVELNSFSQIILNNFPQLRFNSWRIKYYFSIFHSNTVRLFIKGQNLTPM